jgi:hypothetical protein
VLDEAEPGAYLVQLYSWLTGDASGVFTKPAEYFNGARFYDTHADWIEAAKGVKYK